MATLVLGAAGAAIGGAFGGAVLGVSAATIGGAIGSALGSAVDAALLARLAPTQRFEGARLDSLRITTSTEGMVIPRLYGRMRIGGNIIWATDFREESTTTSQRVGKGSRVRTTEYSYFASFAVALCEGPITGIGRVWADGRLVDTAALAWTWYPGDETQPPDPTMQAALGADATPAYRGTAYVVFSDLDLGPFGNRIPQLSFEVFRPLPDPDTAEGAVRAVTMIPASGEFTYATQPIRKTDAIPGAGEVARSENANAMAGVADVEVSLDRMRALAPAVESVSLVVAWFGDDLRLGDCRIRPGVEFAEKATSPRVWSVNGVARAAAHLVSRDDEERPIYGGTPADFSVVQAIQAMKARGLRVTFYPFILMDVPPGNSLPDPYSDNAAQTGQPVFPWRGRITVSPAAGFAGSPDKTPAASAQVSAFFGAAQPSHFAVSDDTVVWTGPAGDWGLRRMILHYAHLCAAAGGVDAFLIGTEMRGLTTVRDGAASYPAVQAFRSLLADVRAILGAGTKISYAADWSEYFGHQPGDGTGDVFFHLDPFWADANTDFVGIDNYMPLSDWRDGFEHADAQAWDAVHQRGYLMANVEGGEGFDWFYASAEDRESQIRTPISDGAGKPWVFRYKDLRSWWSNEHRNRPAGVEGTVAWSPTSLASGLTMANGTVTPGFAVDPAGRPAMRATHANNINSYLFRSALAVPAGSYRVAVRMRTVGSAPQTTNLNIFSGSHSRVPVIVTPEWQVFVSPPITVPGGNINVYPSDPRGGGDPDVDLLVSEVWLIGAAAETPWVSQSKPVWFTEFGCPAVDRGTNQPNVFFDPKSSESFLPYFSRGWRDDAIQRAYLEATALHWQDPANNPVSAVYGAPMIHWPECAAWTWDSRPYPFFPELTEVWADGANWRLGHWLTGRLGAVSLAALVRHLCLRAGMPAGRIDVSDLWGAVEGLAVTAVESPRMTIAALMRHFGFEAVESGGVLRFRMRVGRPAAVLTEGDLAGPAGAESVELNRGQESELPQGLKWQVARADGDYDAVMVEARRATAETHRLSMESFALAVPPEEAERRCRRALAEAWTGRETAAFRLPPSRLALDPGDVVALARDGRALPYRLSALTDGTERTAEAVRFDAAAADPPPGAATRPGLTRPVAFAPPAVAVLDLPVLSDEVPGQHLWVAALAEPWPGAMAVTRAEGGVVQTLPGPARMGTLAADLGPGPWSRWDTGNALELDLAGGSLSSVTDAALFSGANAFVLGDLAGLMEIVQAAEAELIAPGRWRLTRLLRGQRGTEEAIRDWPAGTRVVMLDSGMRDIAVAEAALGQPLALRVGAAAAPPEADAFTELTAVPTGVGLRPFSPVHVRQPWRHGRVPGDLDIRWIRRSRALAADNWDIAEVPVAEETEAWEVQIFSGLQMVRTISSIESRATYTAAQQEADLGALLGPGDTLDVRILQFSTRVGWGAGSIHRLFF